MFLIVFFASFTILYLYHLWTNREYYKVSLKLPGPLIFPFIGSAYLFVGATNEGILKAIQRVTSYSNLARYWLGTDFFIMSCKPEDLQVILTSPHCLNRGKVYDFTKCYTGDGLLSLNDNAWKTHRKLINPCFNLKILQSFLPIFNKEIKIMGHRFDKLSRTGETFDIYKVISACTLDMVCQTTLGTPMNIQQNENPDYLDSSNKLLELIAHRMVKPWYHFDWIYKLTPMYQEEKVNGKVIHEFVQKIVNEKKKNLTNKNCFNLESELNESESFKTPQIFIDQMLKLYGKHFDDWDMLSEAITIVVTGYESSALMTAYAILMLAMHPEYQDRVHEEVMTIFGKKNFEITYNDFCEMEFTERVIKETLRLFPTVPVFARRTTAPFDLNGLTIPTGTTFVIVSFKMHRDEEYWGPRAKIFDPDHFLPENFEAQHPYSYIPFSAGPRNCLGIKYAMMSMKSMIAHSIANYRFSTKLKMEDLRYRMDVALKLGNGHMVTVERRQE